MIMNRGLVRFLSCFIPDKVKRHHFIAKHRNLLESYNSKNIIDSEEAQSLIINKLQDNKPCLICRYGLAEFRVLYTYLYKKSRYKKRLMDTMCSIYPVSKESLDRFAKMLVDISPNIDVLAAWQMEEEEKVCKKYCRDDIEYVKFKALTSIVHKNPWTSALKGKKVLVILPFEESVKNQYERRNLLFENPDTLPDFELMTLKPVYITKENIEDQPYDSWFDALDSMKRQIDTFDFDVALIGAGPFGIFLADYCKSIGKKAVHVGGATQLLFGIIGRRWEEEYPDVAKMINEYWIRPSENEKPKGFKKIEGGCYW